MFFLKNICCPRQQKNTPNLKVYSKQQIVRINDLDCQEQTKTKQQLKISYHDKDNHQSTFDNENQIIDKNKNIRNVSQFQSTQGEVGSEISSTVFDSMQILNQPQIQLLQIAKSQRQIRHQNLNKLQFNQMEIREWSVKNVLNFLGKIGLKKYQTVFYENKVKGKDLITLTEKQLIQDLTMDRTDVKILEVYLQILKQNAQKQKQIHSHKNIIRLKTSKKLFNSLSLSNTPSSCRKLLNLVSNPIIQQSEQDPDQSHRNKQIYTSNFQSQTNLNSLLSH